jgi:DNA-binding transcriptional LysR family regulator
MTNIPTDLLRTLVAVVDLRSFTKAAISLGVTQPAVSAQIKRLQFLLGSELFNRGAQGVELNSQGELVVTYARRLLSINDQIVHLAADGSRAELSIRVGTPSDFVASALPDIFARLRELWPKVRFSVHTDFADPLMRELRNGDIDLYVGLSTTVPFDARHSWPEEVVWVRGDRTQIDRSRPVPLVSYGESCVYYRLVTAAMKSAGLDWECAFTGPSITSLDSAVSAGFGVMAIIRRRALETGMNIWEDAPLPKLPNLYSGVFVREGGASAAYEQLADELAAELQSPSAVPTKIIKAIQASRRTDTAA